MTSAGDFESPEAVSRRHELVDGLERFLRTEAQVKKAQIEDIQSLTNEVLEVFTWSFDEEDDMGTWPYQLVNDEPRDKSLKYSFSTAAMIAFALGLANGRIQQSALAPTGGRSTGLEKDLGDRIDTRIGQALDLAIQKSRQVRSKSKREDPPPRYDALTESTTFGWDDPFTLMWLLDVLRGSKERRRRTFRNLLKTRAWERIDEVLADPSGSSDTPGKLGRVLQVKSDELVPHSFPLLRFLQLGDSLSREDSGVPLGRRPAAAKARDYLFQRIHLQLSESQIPEGGFDAGDLVFALEGWILTSAAEPELELVARAFDTLAAGHRRTAYWRPLRPFRATGTGLVLLPQSVEVANSLLRICSSPALARARYFSRHVGLFDLYARWLLARVFRGSREGEDRQFVGWESEHTYTLDRIHLWQTSQVLIFLLHYVTLLQQHIAQTSRELAGFVLPGGEPEVEKTRLEKWNEYRASEPLATASKGSEYRVYEQIDTHFVRPRTVAHQGEPAFSMVLYGPPGTGKSTIARKLAESLGFGMLRITPSDFIAFGGEAVEARAKAIFQMLDEQSDLVVLFDEIDQLLLDRDSGFYAKQSDLFKLLTPGMLTKLGDLADRSRVIFVVATNYYERIDRAIKRPGRIGGRYLVLPPDSRQRRRHLTKEQPELWSAISTKNRRKVVTDTVRYTYRELDDLAGDVKKRQASGTTADEAVVAALDAFRPIITIGGYWQRLGLKSTGSEVVEAKAETVERPYEELALLAYLELEAHDRLPEGLEWLPGALELARKGKVLRDPKIEEALWGS